MSYHPTQRLETGQENATSKPDRPTDHEDRPPDNRPSAVMPVYPGMRRIKDTVTLSPASFPSDESLDNQADEKVAEYDV